LERFFWTLSVGNDVYSFKLFIRRHCNQFHLQETQHSEGISLSQNVPQKISCDPHEKLLFQLMACNATFSTSWREADLSIIFSYFRDKSVEGTRIYLNALKTVYLTFGQEGSVTDNDSADISFQLLDKSELAIS
jgi:hypothetical protein